MTVFAWSNGRNRYDNAPMQRSADSLREFAHDVLVQRAIDKASAFYICGPFGGDGRRAAKNALPRAWLALDVDGIAPDVFVDWRLFLTRYRERLLYRTWWRCKENLFRNPLSRLRPVCPFQKPRRC